MSSHVTTASTTTTAMHIDATSRRKSAVNSRPALKTASVRSRVLSITKNLFDEPEYGKPIPWYLFHKTRWYRFFSFLLACLLTTVVYIGWPPLTTLFIRSNAYASRCDAAEPPPSDPDRGCIAQQRFFEHLYYIGLASESLVGAVAGVSFDKLGPFATAFVGELMFITGWLFFTFSNSSVNLFVPGIIFLAGAANMVSFPTLILSDMFPKAGDWMTSVVVAAQCSAAFVPVVLLWISERYPSVTRKTLFLYYFYFIVIPISLLFLISVPLQRRIPHHQHADQEDETETYNDNECGVVLEELHPDIGISHRHINSPLLIQQLLSNEYILFSCFYIVQQLQYAYFPIFLRDSVSPALAQILATALPTQGLVGPILGAIAQKTKTLPICIFISALMSVGYATVLTQKVSLAYVAIVCYVIANSYIFTAKYTYVSEVFPLTHFGVLVGLISAISGVITLSVSFIPNSAPIISCVVYCVSGLLALLLAVVLLLRQRRTLRPAILTKSSSYSAQSNNTAVVP